ncbi:hypothetical protein KAU11_08125, partial [Candidatus Babeliales bacterium]|nr:hypothetical protein [Candidatus Babeliales bacterium]
MFAASCNFAVITELLLDRSNVNIWWRDEDGFTAVDYAIKEGFAEILKLFLVRGMFIAPLARIKCSDEIATMIRNKKHYLPRWSRFNTCKYYPREFNFVIARVWLLCCKRSKLLRKLSRDVWYLMIEYFAEAWKQSWDREDVIKGLRKEIEILNKVKIQLY